MIRINQLKLPIHHSREQLEQKLCKSLHIRPDELESYEIVRQSIDARKKPDLQYVYSVDAIVKNEHKIISKANSNNIMSIKKKAYTIRTVAKTKSNVRPVIVGAGPAGLFCAYALCLSGIYPLVVERGKSIEERACDVNHFWKTGVLDVSSNVQFGEGGAGTFSDGKLNTLVKDAFGRNRFVLETFVKFGAPNRILYENKPHIGTDILAQVILNMRREMEDMGAIFRFETCMTDYRTQNGALSEIELNQTEWIKATQMVLAIGHSARDTFRMLEAKQDICMQAKSFAVGFRVEHPQEMINLLQYGEVYAKELPAAPYKVTSNLKNGRGVYSFCMCPGGYIVNASSELKRLAVNGMSYAKRDGKNANSAIIVSVSPEDFDGVDALSGVRFQEALEEKAFQIGNGKIPQQLFADFCSNKPSQSYGAFESTTKGAAVLTNLRGLFSEPIEESFIEGMQHFAKSIQGFNRKDAILSGVESRTSSPVRILRDEKFMADVSNVFPCGEGAGYAGGIMSAAMDGLKVAEAMLNF